MSFQLSAFSLTFGGFAQQKIKHLIPDSDFRHSSAILWLVALMLYILAGTPVAPFHGDEATQIFMSRDYAYQFLQGDLARITSGGDPDNDTEQYLRLINGTLNKYYIGLAWHVSGFDVTDVNEQWDWGADWDYNQRTGHIPSDGLLLASRWPSALLLAGGVVLMFVLGWEIGGNAAAYFASLYYALNPALLLNGRRAMMEGSLIFFGLLVVLAGVWFLRRQTWLTTALLGMASGLALASKHTNVFTVAAMFGVCGVYIVRTFVMPRQTLKRPAAEEPSPLKWTGRPFFLNSPLALFFMSVVIASLLFFALNPAWWSDPIDRLSDMLRLRQELLDIQADVFGGYENLADKAAGFARQVFIALPQYYEVPAWSGYIGGQVARYEASVWRGVSIGGSLPGGALLLGMMGIGVWTLLRDTSLPTRWLIGTWALVMITTTLIFTPVEWQRYYLPAFPAVGLLAALGLTHLIRRFRT